MEIGKLPVLEQLEIYRCSLCGTLTEILGPQGLELVCCGRSMTREEENTAKPHATAHSISVKTAADGLQVTVGRPPHSMTRGHQILWIEVVAEERIARRFFQPGELPEAVFQIAASKAYVRAYCNKHGLWRSPEYRLKVAGMGQRALGALVSSQG